MTSIGHNRPPALPSEVNRETAFYMLGREYLITAIQDRKLERAHLRVLACIVMMTDKETFEFTPRRAQLVEETGYAPKTVSNILRELREHGYLVANVSEDATGDERNSRSVPYTFGKIDHDTIRREITAFTMKLREARDAKDFPARGEQKSPPAGNNEVPARGEQLTGLPRPRGTMKSPPAGNNEKKHSNINEGSRNTSPPAGNNAEKGDTYTSTSLIPTIESENNTEVVAPKTNRRSGTSLPDDWFLPQPWGEWALETFMADKNAIRAEAEKFKDYYLSAAGAKGRKADWSAAWRNWCRGVKNWTKRPNRNVNRVDDLLSIVGDEVAVHNPEFAAEWEKARALAPGDDDEC